MFLKARNHKVFIGDHRPLAIRSVSGFCKGWPESATHAYLFLQHLIKGNEGNSLGIPILSAKTFLYIRIRIVMHAK